MFTKFDNIFKKNKSESTTLPKELIECFNDELPKGLHYAEAGEGFYVVTSDTGKINVSGIEIDLTEAQKTILGENVSRKDILEFAYNSQQQINFKLSNPGHITINGNEITLDKWIHNPFIKLQNGNFFLNPSKFPEPFDIKLSGYNKECILKSKRIPNDSIDIKSFEASGEFPLMLKYNINEKHKQMHFTISIIKEKISDVKTFIDALYIYNAFIEGKGNLFDKPLIVESMSSDSKIEDELIQFWEKVYSIENVLGMKFKAIYGDVDYGTAFIVEKLYQNLINKYPIRENKKIDSISGKWEFTSKDISLDNPVYFQFDATSDFDLFGVAFSLPSIVSLFNAKVVKINKQTAESKIYLDDFSEDKNMYVSIINFTDNEDMSKYKLDNAETLPDKMKKARMISDYMR